MHGRLQSPQATRIWSLPAACDKESRSNHGFSIHQRLLQVSSAERAKDISVLRMFDSSAWPGKHDWSKKQLGAKGIATRSKDAISGSWPYY